jgi:hypothetical protein
VRKDTRIRLEQILADVRELSQRTRANVARTEERLRARRARHAPEASLSSTDESAWGRESRDWWRAANLLFCAAFGCVQESRRLRAVSRQLRAERRRLLTEIRGTGAGSSETAAPVLLA